MKTLDEIDSAILNLKIKSQQWQAELSVRKSYIDGQEHEHAEQRHKTFHDDDAKAKAAFKDIKASIIEAKMNVDDLQAEINNADAEIEELLVEREAADDAAERAKYER